MLRWDRRSVKTDTTRWIRQTSSILFKKAERSSKEKKAIYLECLAIKQAIKYWQYWLLDKSFEVYSDHKSLENMNIKSRPDEELGELTYFLSQYNFKIKYTPGKENLEADCLRIPESCVRSY